METMGNLRDGANTGTPRVLIVDDERDAVDLLELLLTREHYLVEKAYNAKQAIYSLNFSSELPNLILLDVKMPGTDGFTFCQNLKKNPRFKKIPVIILSALTFPEDIEKGFESGAVDYIIKPWNNDDLLQRINRYLPS